MSFEGLTEELKAKAKTCKTPEELTALAEAEGIELTDEMLEAVSGGVSDETCIELDTCASYCQIFEYYGRGRDGDAFQCTWVTQSNAPAAPLNCMEVTGI